MSQLRLESKVQTTYKKVLSKTLSKDMDAVEAELFSSFMAKLYSNARASEKVEGKLLVSNFLNVFYRFSTT